MGDVAFVSVPEGDLAFLRRTAEIHPQFQDQGFMDIETLDLAGLFVHYLAFADLAGIVVAVAPGDEKGILFRLVRWEIVEFLPEALAGCHRETLQLFLVQDQGARLVELFFRAVAELLVAIIRRQLLDATRPRDGFRQFSGFIFVVFAGSIYLVIAETEKVGIADPFLYVFLDAPSRALLRDPRLHRTKLIRRQHQRVFIPQPGTVASVFPVGDIVVIIIKAAVDAGKAPRLAGGGQDVFRAVAGGDGFLICWSCKFSTIISSVIPQLITDKLFR